MIKFCVLIVAIKQQTSGYRHSHLLGARYDLPQNDPDKYINFKNFDDSPRPSRQLNTGFNWDSPSSSFDIFNNRRLPISNSFETNQDSFVFEDDFENRNFVGRTTQRAPTFQRKTTTQRTSFSTVAIPGMGTPRTPCENRCLSTPEYNPVCGDDDMTYFSMHRLNCAQKCGKSVNLKHMGACSLIPPRG